jgi:N-acylneuraminate cytidylyltransferase
VQYDLIVLLQPTSPFRKIDDVIGSIGLYESSLDMVVTVKETAANPYYNCYEEDANGYLVVSKGDGKLTRRQDAPPAYEWNGAVYVINPSRLMEVGLSGLIKVKKYVMDDLHSIDLDTMFDWKVAELILKEKLI